MRNISDRLATEKEKKSELLRVIATEHPSPTWELVGDMAFRIDLGENQQNCGRRLRSLCFAGKLTNSPASYISLFNQGYVANLSAL